MKKGVHPQIFKDAKVECACGNVFTTISTKKEISIEICSACHPFYTGQKRYIDTEGQIDKFAKKLKLSQETASNAKTKKKDKSKEERKAPVTLKDLRSM